MIKLQYQDLENYQLEKSLPITFSHMGIIDSIAYQLAKDITSISGLDGSGSALSCCYSSVVNSQAAILESEVTGGLFRPW